MHGPEPCSVVVSTQSHTLYCTKGWNNHIPPGAIARGLECISTGFFGCFYQPLHHAVLFEDCDMIDALLEAGACIHGHSAETNIKMEDYRDGGIMEC